MVRNNSLKPAVSRWQRCFQLLVESDPAAPQPPIPDEMPKPPTPGKPEFLSADYYLEILRSTWAAACKPPSRQYR